MRFLRLTSLAAFIGALICAATASTAQDAYRVKSGDILRVEVVQDPELNRTVLVSPDGRISFPLAGAVRARGRSIEEIQATLTDRLSGSFQSPPTVFVGIQQLAERPPLGPPVPDPVVTIFVMGEAANAGKVELVPGTTLLQAFAQIGGFTNFAATKRIQLRRGNQIYQIDYDSILAGANNQGAITMAEGDVLVVPQRRLFE